MLLSIFSFTTIHAEITWTLSDDGTLTISGTGDIPDYNCSDYSYSDWDAPWSFLRYDIKKVEIKNGVTSVGKNAFCWCENLTSVAIPNSVTSIGEYAFYWCENLTSVILPNSVTAIGKYAFYYCVNLTTVNLPNSVTSIGEYAFYGCSGLSAINIPNSMTSIEDYTFYGCSGLTSATLSNSLTTINNYAFDGCSGLTTIIIPNSVTSIGYAAFNNCSGLKTLIVEKGNTVYDSRNNCNAIIETKSNTLIRGCMNTVIPNSISVIGVAAFGGYNDLVSMTIPNSVKKIEYYAFHSCKKLTSINIPNSVISIGDGAFIYCENLTSINIPNLVTTIETQTFYFCKSLTSIIIPNSVKSIGWGAFYGCSNLTSITCESTTPPSCNSSFLDVDKSIPVYVPTNSIVQYKSADYWKDFTNIHAISRESTLIDGKTYTNNLQLSGREISYTRTFTNINWQALYIPFSISYDNWKKDFDIAYINGIRQYDMNDDGTIDETIMDVIKIKNGSLIPNTPYLIKAKTTGEKTITLNNATLYKAEENSIDCRTTIAEYTFTGTYRTIQSSTLIANNYYAMGGGSLVITDGTSDLKPYRWYMKIGARSPMYNVSNGAKTITINVVGEEETTGITNTHPLSPNNHICDLNGRRVDEKDLKPGIYIKNGKKIIIK